MPAKKVIFRITSDYQVERLIGQGAFGVVWYVLCRYIPVPVLMRSQLRRAPTLGEESGDQEDHTFRPQWRVSSSDARDQIVASP